MSDLIAKRRRTVLKISPPKNPRFYGGTPCGQTGSQRRRVEIESTNRWRPLPLTWQFRWPLRPPMIAPLCGGVAQVRCGVDGAPAGAQRQRVRWGEEFSGEAPPAAEKASRKTGSGALGGPKGFAERIAATRARQRNEQAFAEGGSEGYGACVDEAGPKARKSAQRQGDTRAPERGGGTLLYIKRVLRGRSP